MLDFATLDKILPIGRRKTMLKYLGEATLKLRYRDSAPVTTSIILLLQGHVGEQRVCAVLLARQAGGFRFWVQPMNWSSDFGIGQWIWGSEFGSGQ